ncbi:hypothetical protein B0H17DRAFT_1134061 [Mycena rosella]|uniref:DUF6593 domain-containing protein n=1 Tax=Mycena rosella TaxID=1033263 RepID=A0AAD7GER8_MYCRO|nr:hypothetical protein B0H17DRAFT_1134061 [Mycena rosella]
MSKATVLAFESNSMLATTIARGGAPLYAVSTNQHGSTTEIRAPGTNTLLARIARRELLPDTIAFADGKPARLSKWLKQSTLADGLPGATFDTPLGACVLRAHPEHRLALYSADLTRIVAHWGGQSLPPAVPLAPMQVTMALVFPKAVDAASEGRILAAFLFQEQRTRVAERNGEVHATAVMYRAELLDLAGHQQWT